MFSTALNNALTRANIDLFTPDYENPTVLNGSLSDGNNSITITEPSFIVAISRQTTDVAYIVIYKNVSGIIHRIGTQYNGNDGKEKRFAASANVPAGTYIINHTGTGGIYNVYPLKGAE